MASLGEDALAALAENEAHYQALVQASGQITWTMPPDGLVSSEQRAWCAYTGQRSEEIMGWGWLDAVHPDDRGRVKAAWSGAVNAKAAKAAARTAYETVFRVRRADGVYRTFLARGLPLLNEDGTVREWLGFCTDITTQQKAQTRREGLLVETDRARITVQAREIETLLETITDGVGVFDAAGRVVRANAAGKRLFGYGAELSDGSMRLSMSKRIKLLGLRDESGHLFTSETFPLSRMLRGEVLSGESAVDVIRSLADGGEMRINISGGPLRDAKGVIIGAVSIARDVTERRRIERRLQETAHEGAARASELQAIFDALADKVIVYDMEDRVLYFNAAARFGGVIAPEREQVYFEQPLAERAAQSAPRDTQGNLMPQDQWPLRRAQRGEVITGDAGVDIIFRMPDGSDLWVNQSAAPMRDAEGQIVGAVVVSRDVTVQRRLEQRVREAAREAAARTAQLEAIFNAIADSLYVYDRDGHLIQTNAAGLHVNPLSGEQDYLARPLAERIATLDIRTNQGFPFAAEDLPISRVLRGEVLTGARALDTAMHLEDGRDILLNTTGAPVYDADGAITGAVIVSRDVTERRRLEQRMQVALDALLEIAALLVLPQERLDAPATQRRESLFDVPHVGQRLAELTSLVLGCRRVALSAVDRRGEPLRPLAVAGMTPEEEQQWRQGEPKEAYLRTSMPPDYLRRLQAGEVSLIDFTQPPFNRRPNPLHLQSVLIAPMLVGGELVGILNADFGGEAHTYTEQELRLAWAVARLGALVIERERLLRERAEAQANALALREANRLMDEFLGIASHELRTPLTTFSANVQIAERWVQRMQAEVGHTDGALATQMDALQGLLTRAEAAAARQDRLVSDLLDVSRIQAGKLEMRPEHVDLRLIVRECVEEQRLAHPRRSISLELPEEEMSVHGDGDRIGQVITNYLTNALKYSNEEKPVAVLLRRDGQRARVEVRDEGLGLPPEEQARIWDRFYRSPGIEHQSGSGVGLGLGLHISKTIVDRHGGQVGVESVRGDGSTFWFVLPLAPNADA